MITREDRSVFVDMKGGLKRITNHYIKWSDKVSQVHLISPYLVGILPTCVEFRCVFNPKKVVQRLSLKNSKLESYAIGYNLTDIDSLYLILSKQGS